jgi:3-oxoacyl-(acyl-carrier-protein) synthase
MGVASPWGGWRATEARLLDGDTAIAPVTRFDVSGYPCAHAAVGPHGLWADDPRAALALAALDDAGGRAGLGAAARIGVFWGSESGLARFRCAFELVDAVGRGPEYDDAALRDVEPDRLPGVARALTSPASPAIALAQVLGATGPVLTISHACAAGASAIAEGLRAIRQGRCDVAVCGGVGADVDPLVLSGFGRLGVLSERGRCTPFDAGRDGFVLGEGAALVVLSAARGDATIELRGAGRTLDGGSLTAPDREGDGAARAIRAALRDGTLEATDT